MKSVPFFSCEATPVIDDLTFAEITPIFENVTFADCIMALSF
jgi:hypothetical protein